MAEIDWREAKSQLSALIDRVECGETLTLTRDGKPVARMVPIAHRRPGLLKGRIAMAPEFDVTPEWLMDAFEGCLKNAALPNRSRSASAMSLAAPVQTDGSEDALGVSQ